MRRTFYCGVDSSRVPVVCVRWIAPSLVRTSFGRSSDPTDMREVSPPQPNVLRMLECKRLNIEVTGVFAKARTSRAQLKPQEYLGFGQKVSLYSDRIIEINLLHRSRTGSSF